MQFDVSHNSGAVHQPPGLYAYEAPIRIVVLIPRKEIGMKFKLTVLTLLVMGLVMALAPVSMAALPTLANNVAIATGTVAAKDSTVIGSYSVSYAAAADAMVGFGLLKGTHTTALTTDLTNISIYEDINKNGAFEAGVDSYVGRLTPAQFDAGGNIAYAHTAAAVEVQYFIVVATVKQTGATYTALDGKVLDCKLDINNAAGLGGSVTEAANNQTIQIVASHLAFDTAGRLLLQVAATTTAVTDGDGFLKAVDDYGNLDAGFGETVKLAAYSYSSGATYAGLTATANGAGALDVVATGVAMTAGEIDVTVAGAANEMFDVQFAADGDYMLVANSITTKLLQGSVNVRVGAYTTVTGVLTTRGIEFYDTNHNGHLDAVTIFFDAPININATTKSAFTVAGYTIATDPVTKFDAGGVGIRNGGEYGVSMTLTELAAYDTGAKPQVTYNAAVGTLRDKNVPTYVTQIVDGTAVEVDKARPILVSAFTRDTDATADGKIDAIVLTYSEPLASVTASTSLIAALGTLEVGVGSSSNRTVGLRSTLQNGNPTTITLASGSAASNVITLVVNETIPNTGILPAISYVDNSAETGCQIRDSATNAIGGSAANVYINDLTNYAKVLASIIVKDGASPIITDATTVDSAGGNGKIDKIVVTFSENMNTNALYAFGGVSFYSNLATFKSNNAANNVYTVVSGSATTNQITFTITEAGTGVYDTEATPIFRYNATTGSLFDANGFELATYTETGGGGRVQEVPTFDGAAPVAVKKETGDNKTVPTYAGGKLFDAGTTPNGRLDTMVLEFSEEIAATSMDGGLTAVELDALIAEFTLTYPVVGALTLMNADTAGGSYDVDAVPTLVHTTATDSKSVLTLYHQEVGFASVQGLNFGDTGVMPTVTYALGAAADQIKDKNSVALVAFAGAASTDKAKPIISNGLVAAYVGTGFSNIITMDRDAITFGADKFTGDGYLDAFQVKFSETVKMAGVDSSAVSTYFTIANGDGWSTISLSTFDIDRDGDVNLNGSLVADASDRDAGLAGFNYAYVYGTSSKLKDKWDTGRTPTFKYNGGSDIIDSAGNALNTFGALPSYDGASPVAVLAVGAVDADEIKVTFSELPYATNVGGTSFAAVNGSAIFGYANGNGTGVSALAATPVTLSGNTMTVKTTGTLSLSDVEQDSIWVKFDDVVFDFANAAPFTNLAVNEVEWDAAGVGYKIIINDIIAPWITSAQVIDANGNGKVDHIRFTISELIDDTTLNGYVSANAMTTNVAATWQLQGYTGEAKFNLFDGTGAGITNAIKDAARAINMPTFSDNGPNDSVLYLWVNEDLVPVSTSGMGSTDFAPIVTIVGATLSDNKPNLLNVASGETGAFNSGSRAVDKAAPVLMAAQTISTTVLRATFSEALKTSTVANSDFSWRVGTSYTGYQGFVENVTFPSSGVVDLRVGPQNAFSADVGGILAIASTIADNLGDASNNNVNSGADAYAASQWWKGSADSYVVDGGPGNVASSKTITVGATTIAAVTALAVADVPGDNGYWAMVAFTPSASTDVNSYQFYWKDVVTVTNPTPLFHLYASAGKAVVQSDAKMHYLVPVPRNGISNIGVAASTATLNSTVVSGTVTIQKAAGVEVAQVVESAARVASEELLSEIVSVEVAIVDDIAPSPLTVLVANDNPGAGSGILVSWTPPADHGVLGSLGNNQQYYGVEQYNIYRLVGADFVLAGSAPRGSVQFIDPAVTDGITILTYRIESVDTNPDHTMQSAVRSVIALSAQIGDFNGDNIVEASDFAIFATNYGTTFTASPTTFLSAFDFNNDTVVEASDFAVFAAHYGEGVSAKVAASLPTSGIQFAIGAESDPATSMFYVTVTADEIRDMAGLAFNLTYDANALEFVENSVNGTVGLVITRGQEGLVHVADMFVGEQFNGAITLGFKALGAAEDLTFGVTGSIFMGESYAEMSINGVETTTKVAPTVYSLSKNYPNPFNPTTTIDYTIPEAGMVNLVIYNTAGQKVRTLVNQTQDAAYYKVVWDGRDDSGMSVASGIYFYRLSADKFSKIDKMTLLK